MSDDHEKSAFLEQLFVETYDGLIRFAGRSMDNPDLAQDLVQDTFLVALIKIDDLISSAAPRGWLFKTLKNIIGNTCKQRQKMLSVMVPLSDCEESEELELSVALQYKGIIDEDALKPLIWVYCEGLSYQQAADRLGINLFACKKRIQRAREEFKRKLDRLNKK